MEGRIGDRIIAVFCICVVCPAGIIKVNSLAGMVRGCLHFTFAIIAVYRFPKQIFLFLTSNVTFAQSETGT